MELREKLEQTRRNCITLKISGRSEQRSGTTRFGGRPDVPRSFTWPVFDSGEMEKNVKKGLFSFLHVRKDKIGNARKPAARPLSFIAQFDCAELAKYDTEHLLPNHGILSFFYETYSQRWGFDPKDKGCARVYWFENSATLEPAEFPDDLEEDFKFPALNIKMRAEPSFPEWDDFSEIYPGEAEDGDEGDEFFKARAELADDDADNNSKLLGWPDTIQGSIPIECELVTRGYYLGGDWSGIPENVEKEARSCAADKWLPLLQLDAVECGDFSLMFGDCGRIYFYITRDDLSARRFENVWLILQCY